LYPIYCKTDKDGDKDYYAGMLKKAVDMDTPQEGSMGELESMSREAVDHFVQQRVVPESMFIYRSSDFEGIGRNKFKKVTTEATAEAVNEPQQDDGNDVRS
jgi:hypothetical protein